MSTITRRDFFKVVAGVATTVGLAGCLASIVEDEEEKDSQEENQEHTHEDGQPHTH
ncbi:twin-arginine translocation signal domain-containing protein [Candidatus Parabeggiatoa sp. HSG14]|uniref:twin-arginine translocation signal domain-containing protein n=1 Tax=Candidatus Parabeggiatoa sp. HSG14 TaxID=3055593 RepID=UPI0025A92417|nr:twin-arginine translocation signal domain-containing protein [Thiotrichales bacterium HSG14]